MKPARTFVLAARFAVAAAVAALASSSARADDVRIPFTSEKLPNGLTAIYHEDHTLPIAVVDLTYKVGSRFEEPHRTGFAHLFEHLMFMGTRRAPTKMYDAWMEGAGGYNNASTTEDKTNYFDVGPPTALPLLLWLEADRMLDLGPLMTQEKLDAQRDVVRNERRQTSENQPYGKVELLLPELLFPEGHPYHHPVIGSHQDLEAAGVGDVQGFFATWYDPSNASLVVAGDFDAAQAHERVARWFGSVPSHGQPRDPGAMGGLVPSLAGRVTTLASVVRSTVEDRVELAKTVMAWQSPAHFAPGDAELDMLASILTTGKASRLYKSLVYDQKLAQSVEAGQESGVIGSRFVIDATARPGVSLDRLEAAIDKELARARSTAPSEEEMTRARNGIQSAFVRRLQSVQERAALLNMYQVELGDPGYAEKDYARYSNATGAGVRDATTKVLDPNARVVLRVVPKKESP
jgi:zinc protease